MKKQIRKNVFETNSSSTHSITMCMKSDYDKWENGELLLYTGCGYGYLNNNYPMKNHFYTLEEAIQFEQILEYNCLKDVDLNDKEAVLEELKENDWYTYENYDNDYLEWFEDSFTTSSGETVVAFGQYGYDG